MLFKRRGKFLSKGDNADCLKRRAIGLKVFLARRRKLCRSHFYDVVSGLLINLFLCVSIIPTLWWTISQCTAGNEGFCVFSFLDFAIVRNVAILICKTKRSPSPRRHNARKFIPLRNHKSNRFLLSLCFSIVPEILLAEESIERSVIYLHLTTGWDKSSVQLRCFIMSMRITPNSLNRLRLCAMIQFSFLLPFAVCPPEDGETHQVGKFNKEKSKLVLHLQSSVISWSSFTIFPPKKKLLTMSELWRKNFKQFLCAERMFDHFLPAEFSISRLVQSLKLFFHCLMQLSLRIQLFCIITLCLFIAL